MEWQEDRKPAESVQQQLSDLHKIFAFLIGIATGVIWWWLS